MNATSDAELARLLQLEFDQETASNIADIQPVPSNERRSSGIKPIGIVDERWELIDPIPDIRALFLQYNDKFFWGRLAGVEVRWSPRMTLCAGLCCYEGYGGLCSIRLSQPLLKLRPRKDLVETLLHEMIHAYLFVTQNNKDHDGHGPEFCKHMNRINSATGTNISIYHTFHDEVDLYRQHWWRCDGPCRQRKPYFGYVKRSMNRAPSPRDPWWGEHQRSCGGTYIKIKEPEGYGQKKGGKKKGQEGEEDGTKESSESKGKPEKPGVDIRNFIPFSGKGQTVGKPGASTTSSSFSSSSSSKASSLSGPSLSSSSSNSTSSKATSDKSGTHSKERTRSSESKDISSFFMKKGSNKPVLPSYSSTTNSVPPHGANESLSLGRDVRKKPQFTPVIKTASGRVVMNADESGPTLNRNWKPGDVQTKPRFTPVIKTAGGRVVVDSEESGSGSKRTWNSSNIGETKEPDSNGTQKKTFTPVVAAVGRKDGSRAISKSAETSSNKDLSKENRREHSIGKASSSSSSSGKTMSTPSASEGGRINGPCGDRVGKKNNRVSSEGNKKKRARLVDLQAMFDSDSDEDAETLSRLSKHPRYSHDDSDEAGSERTFGTTSAGSNKENSPALRQNHHSRDRGEIYIHGDSDDDDNDAVVMGTSNSITTGIWKDLNHLSSGSSGNHGNRRFGRVSPPRWGKSKRKTNRGSEVGQTPPRSSFCEHPWETAAKESDKKASAAVSRVTGGVVNLTADEDDDVGPKKVPCPVCNLQIEERKINTHLDTCLTYNCDALFS